MKVIVPGMVLWIMYIKSNLLLNEVVYVDSAINGKKYLVRNMDDKQEAADLLAFVSTRLSYLVGYVISNSSKYPDKSEEIKMLQKRFNPDKISERGNGFNYGELSTYTVNKGESMVFCLRTRDSDEALHDRNTLLFVAIHELGHVASKSEGHNDEFKRNNEFLLKAAIESGIYRYHDFAQNPKMYCGVKISSNVISPYTH